MKLPHVAIVTSRRCLESLKLRSTGLTYAEACKILMKCAGRAGGRQTRRPVASPPPLPPNTHTHTHTAAPSPAPLAAMSMMGITSTEGKVPVTSACARASARARGRADRRRSPIGADRRAGHARAGGMEGGVRWALG